MSKFIIISPVNHGWGFVYGFFSNYRVCLDHIMQFEQQRKPYNYYIDWSNTTFVDGFNPFVSTKNTNNINPFDYWFEQNIPNEYDEKIYNKMGSSGFINHGETYFGDSFLLKQQEIDNKIRLKQYIYDKIENFYNDYFLNEIVLGVMLRGSEYNVHHPMYDVFDIDDYIEEIKKILKENTEITKIFIVSEESEYVNKVHSVFPNSFFIPDVFRRTDETDEYINRVHCWCNVSDKRENHCKLLGEEVIIQTKLLGKCDYLFGRHSGVLAGAVLWNENLKKIYKI